MHFERHQVFEAFKALFGVHDDDGLVRATHAHGGYPSPVRRMTRWSAGRPDPPRPTASDLEGRGARRSTVLCYTSPWSSMALATLRKPPMLAPLTRLPGVPYFSAVS